MAWCAAAPDGHQEEAEGGASVVGECGAHGKLCVPLLQGQETAHVLRGGGVPTDRVTNGRGTPPVHVVNLFTVKDTLTYVSTPGTWLQFTRKFPPREDRHRALGIGLVWGPTGRRFLVSGVSLYMVERWLRFDYTRGFYDAI